MVTKSDILRLSEETSDIQHQLLRLFNLVSDIKKKNKIVVELGMRYGTSTKALIAAVNETGGKVFSVDLVKLITLDEPNLTFILGNDLEVIRTWHEYIDFLFIDTSHTFEQTKNELYQWGAWVVPGGIMALHDTNQDGVMRAIKDYIQNNGYDFENFPESNGLGVIRKKGPRQKCIITAYDKNFSHSENRIVIENKQNYASRYGWNFICKTDECFDKSKPVAFSKINFILEALNNYELVFWNDFDSFFTNYSIDISLSLGENEFIGALNQYDHNSKKKFCSGNILIKSNDYTKELFKKFYTHDQWNNHSHPWEQTAFNKILEETNYKHLKSFKINEFGSFNKEAWWCIRPWEKGDFMIHMSSGTFSGIPLDWKSRLDTFIKIYKDLIIYE